MISLTLRLPLHTKKERPVPHWLRERVGCKVGLDAKWVWTQSGSGRKVGLDGQIYISSLVDVRMCLILISSAIQYQANPAIDQTAYMDA